MARDRKSFELVLDDAKFLAGFSSRFGGVSTPPFESLNLAFHTGDEIENALKNREILRLKMGAKKLVFMEQIHSDKVEILKDLNGILDENSKRNFSPNLGEILSQNSSKTKSPNLGEISAQNLVQISTPCDAIITNLKGVLLAVMVADCMPVLVKGRSSVAAIHAGRAGVMQKIVSKTLNLMSENFGDDEFEIFVGPFIQSSCYAVGNLDLGEFDRFKSGENFSLEKALKFELSTLENYKISNLNISKICTHCDKDYFSYRREKTTGRFAGFIMKKE